MKHALIFLIVFVVAGGAHAQGYKWVDKDGKTRYGDAPPPGVKATTLKGPSSSASAASPAAAAKDGDAKKGPMSSAEKEQEYRKRQQASRKDQEKAEQERQAKADKAEDCARVREYLRTLESGQRIARTDAAGERYYMDEGQVAQEVTKAKQTSKLVCAN